MSPNSIHDITSCGVQLPSENRFVDVGDVVFQDDSAQVIQGVSRRLSIEVSKYDKQYEPLLCEVVVQDLEKCVCCGLVMCLRALLSFSKLRHWRDDQSS